MRVVVLGSGTSAGVPTLGCRCDVCTSTIPENKRMRASVFIELSGKRVLIDCGTDFRTQALRFGVTDVDSVLVTHTHADHVNGIDDLRAFNMIHKHSIDLYASQASLDDLRCRFAYCFEPVPAGGMVPDLNFRVIEGTFDLYGVRVIPVPVFHGQAQILGFRMGDFAYLTDVSHLPDQSRAMVKGVKVLITSALRHRPHPTHMSLRQGVELAEQVGADLTWFTHMSHDLEHHATNSTLPPNMQLAHDGLTFEV